MSTGPLHLRVFLSSPGDVAEEREAVVRLIKDKLPYDDLLRGLVTFEVLAWDDGAQKVALLAGESGQASVDRALGLPGACDLTVVVLWARLGTPPSDRPPKPDGTPYRSGTEWELWDAIHAKKPVLICRRLAASQVDATKLDELQEFARQAKLVDDFLADLAAQKINVNTYREPSEVAALVEGELKRMVRRQLGAGGPGAGAIHPFTIPTPVADFTGREKGKSQLVFELARRMAEHFPDGQVYLDLLGTAPEPLTPEAALADLIRAVHPETEPAEKPSLLAGLLRSCSM